MYSPTGTPSFKAPEILLDIGYTHEIDMWSVGIVCYLLLCGKHPFKNNNNISYDLNFNIKNNKYDFKDPAWD